MTMDNVAIAGDTQSASTLKVWPTELAQIPILYGTLLGRRSEICRQMIA